MLWFNYVLHKGVLIHPSHRFATSFGPISFGRQKTPQAPTDAYAFIRLTEERHYLTQIASFTSHLNLKMYHTELYTEFYSSVVSLMFPNHLILGFQTTLF